MHEKFFSRYPGRHRFARHAHAIASFPVQHHPAMPPASISVTWPGPTLVFPVQHHPVVPLAPIVVTSPDSDFFLVRRLRFACRPIPIALFWTSSTRRANSHRISRSGRLLGCCGGQARCY
jgi:hypothetical protein